ncbi:hypothetical protein MBAV_004717 [Candidatus Magnetobacterium bavaricum]|uniref:Uncharacterized protein n=1 Tax=Candidatus Magnetobacterium bavaricum TaxID=29290 RepID=A0A0F3GM82_9BACT|nr:hypothetical protein MBAV_004717 [Candidatus Magnetobacterium bavaricum]
MRKFKHFAGYKGYRYPLLSYNKNGITNLRNKRRNYDKHKRAYKKNTSNRL